MLLIEKVGINSTGILPYSITILLKLAGLSTLRTLPVIMHMGKGRVVVMAMDPNANLAQRFNELPEEARSFFLSFVAMILRP